MEMLIEAISLARKVREVGSKLGEGCGTIDESGWDDYN